jgi:colanic acid/amylovoran biosynthesis glycosyltransferase
MRAGGGPLTVLQCKFSAYLSWSQPFIHQLVTELGHHVENVVVCNRVENLDRFPVSRLVRFPVRYTTEPRLALLAAAHLERTYAPDLIHAHFGWSGLRMLLMKQYLRIPMVVTFGGRDLGVQAAMPQFDRLYRVLFDAADQMICVSDDLRQEALSFGADPERVTVIRRGTNLERFAAVDRSGRDPHAPLRTLMVGRLIEKKGHRYAFQALADLAARGRDVRLDVVGEGEDFSRLRRIARELGLKERVQFVGTTDHEGVRARMEEADVLIHVSVMGSDGDKEGIPNVVVEGQATGLPVVATRHGGIVEVVRHEETGFLVEERDSEGLAAGLERLLDRDTRLRMGAGAAAFVRAELDMKRQVERTVALYEKLVAECGRDTERMRRHFVPDDFTALVDETLRVRSELSIAELSERLVKGRSFDAGFAQAEAQPGLLERSYDLKRHVPQAVKFPAKMLLGRVLLGAIALRKRLDRSGGVEDPEELDRRVAHFFEEGGRLDVDGEDWGVVDDLLHWHPEERR